MPHNKLILILITASFLLASCGNPSVATDNTLNIVASTTFLADIAQNVAGERAIVKSLLPAGVDPHGYEPVPADVVRVAESKLLIINGLEYEQFIGPLLNNAGGERLVVVASTGLKPRQIQQSADSGQTPGVNDPHMWLDPNRVVTYVENIRDGLIQVDPSGADVYKVNADAYIAQLKDLDAWIVAQVVQIPSGQRLLVTNHESLGYFSDRYGFTLVGTVISGLSSEAATSAQGLAQVIDQVKATGAPAIFLGEVENPDLANQIAAETGVKVVSDLYLESLTAGPPAATYIDMMKYNVSKIVEVLK